MSMPTDSYLYYNINVNNPKTSDENILAQFDESRVSPILMNPSQYELSIVRFEVPTSTIPIMIWPGDDVYKVSISWRNQIVESFVTYAGTGEIPVYGDKFAMYNYEDLCLSVNIALSDCFDQLVALFPGPLPTPDFALYATSPPYLTFVPETNLFIFTVPYQTSNYDAEVNPVDHWSIDNTNIANEIGVFFSKSMKNILKSFPWVTNNDPDIFYQLVIRDTTTNIINIPGIADLQYRIIQNYSTLPSLNTLSDLLFRTSRVPVASEMLGTQIDRTISVLTDFKTFSDAYDSNKVQFFASGNLRYYPLKTDSPLRGIDVQVYWVDDELNEWPLYLAAGETMTIKIQFRKRKEVVFSEIMYDSTLSY